jgi:fructose-1,6-bisphosphatase/inositol monophosphatase family enzyme
VPPSPEEARRLCASSATTSARPGRGSRGIDMAAVTGETVADTIYAIDRVADDALLGWFEEHWPDVWSSPKGSTNPCRRGRSVAWTVIVDTIDGTRGLMYDKRPGLVPGRRCAAGRWLWRTSSRRP